MGWTSTKYSKSMEEFTSSEAVELLSNELNLFPIKEMYLHEDPEGERHEIYARVCHSTASTEFVIIVLVQIYDGEIYWKEMTESMGPYYFNCPKQIYDCLPTTNKDALEWRAECQKRWKDIVEKKSITNY